ncbi:MAG: LPS translocon maturation chaperone LptM [Povalibacter sp.]
MHTSRPLLIASHLLMFVLLSGCGQKGPLYRPDDHPQGVSTPEGSTPARKKSVPTFPAPQTQKEDRVSPPPPSDPNPAPPINDSDRPSPPPPGN